MLSEVQTANIKSISCE